MTDNKNIILAIVLSAVVLIGVAIFRRHAADGEAEAAEPAQQQQAQQTHGQPPAPGAPAPRRSPAQPAPGARRPRRARRPPRRPRSRSRARRRARRRARACRSTRRASNGSIALKGGAHRRPRRWSNTARRSTRTRRRSCCSRPPAARTRTTPSSAGCRPPARPRSCPTRHAVDSRKAPARSTPGHPVTLTWDNGQGLLFRRTIAVDDDYLFTVTDEVANKSAAPVTLYPYALISRHGTPHDRRLLHPARGPDRRARRRRPAGDHLQELLEGRRPKTFKLRRHQRLARHHRQVLGGDAGARPEGHVKAHFSAGTARRQGRPTRPTTCSTPLTVAPGATRRGQRAAVRRRQGSRRSINAYDEAARASTASTC